MRCAQALCCGRLLWTWAVRGFALGGAASASRVSWMGEPPRPWSSSAPRESCSPCASNRRPAWAPGTTERSFGRLFSTPFAATRMLRDQLGPAGSAQRLSHIDQLLVRGWESGESNRSLPELGPNWPKPGQIWATSGRSWHHFGHFRLRIRLGRVQAVNSSPFDEIWGQVG